MQVAHFEYKCRRCGEVFGSTSTGAERAIECLISAMLGIGTGPGIPLTMTDVHHYCQEGRGIGDLVGYRIEEE